MKSSTRASRHSHWAGAPSVMGWSQVRWGRSSCFIIIVLVAGLLTQQANTSPFQDTAALSALDKNSSSFWKNPLERSRANDDEASVQDFLSRAFQFSEGVGDDDQNWPKLQVSWRTVSAVVLGGIGAALSSAGGLGGGGLFVPLFNLLLQFDAKTSAALSNFMILGGSLANLYINLQQHHPTAHYKPLIDFDVVLLLQPNMLLGISTGVILNVILPDWAITALLTITLGYMTVHSFKGGLRRWKKETCQNRQRNLLAAQAENGNGAKAPYVTAPDFHHEHSITTCEFPSSDEDDIHREENEEYRKRSVTETDFPKDEKNEAMEPLLRNEGTGSPKVPLDKVLALAFTWLAFFLIQVLRGSKGNQSILGFRACGFAYWLFTFLQVPLAFGVTAWTMRRLRASYGRSSTLATTVVPIDDDFAITPESCTLFAWMALVAGLLGGLLGIGGGMIVNPLLLTVGMCPQVTAGTCASMVFFSSSMSVVQFSLMGRVPLDYAVASAVLCAIFSCTGVVLVHRAIDKYNRASIIVFSVTAVMGVSALLMAVFGGMGVWEEYRTGEYMGFHNVC